MPEKQINWKIKTNKVAPPPLQGVYGEDSPPPSPSPLKGEGNTGKGKVF